MNVDDVSLRVAREPWTGTFGLLLLEGAPGAPLAYGVAVDMRVARPDEAGTIHAPTFRLSYDAAQRLMDNLWDCGLRPTEGTGSAGALAATQKHLEDMRKLAFDLLNSCASK